MNEFAFELVSLSDQDGEIALRRVLSLKLNIPFRCNLGIFIIRQLLPILNNKIQSIKRRNKIKIDINLALSLKLKSQTLLLVIEKIDERLRVLQLYKLGVLGKESQSECACIDGLDQEDYFCLLFGFGVVDEMAVHVAEFLVASFGWVLAHFCVC